ncbi:MAG TPA: hypothetical protein VFE30_12405 [Anaeromyxobacteraceae bacterium]|jgi:hypothetical protein|nr:hypothetical protein [Anaeromyxobacteraceae bacterium]
MRLLLAALSTLVLAVASPARASSAPRRPALPFVEDDYPKALALARARKLPLFVDAWAPW